MDHFCTRHMQVPLNLGKFHLSHVIRKPVHAVCEQQRHRSACASAQYDQHLLYTLLRYPCIKPIVSTSKISSLKLVFVTAEAHVSLTWSETLKTGFLVMRLISGLLFEIWHIYYLPDSLVVCTSACCSNSRGMSVTAERMCAKYRLSLSRKSMVRLTGWLEMKIHVVVDWDVEPQIKQTNQIICILSFSTNYILLAFFHYSEHLQNHST